jgi:hypothetical protein
VSGSYRPRPILRPLRRLRFGSGEAKAPGSGCPSRSKGPIGRSPADVRRLETLETASPVRRARERSGSLPSFDVSELARSSRPKGLTAEVFGPSPTAPVNQRAGNPMGACRMKQVDEVPGGESRQEGVKPWRRKGCGPGKPAAGVLQETTCRRARPSLNGLPVLMAPKGQQNLRRGAVRGTGSGPKLRGGVSRDAAHRGRANGGAVFDRVAVSDVRLALQRRRACERMNLL